MKYKGTYRLMPDLNYEKTDFSRNMDGSIDEDAVYIKCQFGCKIYSYGNGTLTAYIPSLGRGRNIKKAMDKDKVPYTDYDESDSEAIFHFKAKDIEPIAKLLKVSTSGASISPFSSKNIPKNKEIEIPEDEMQRYKSIASKVDKKDVLKIRTWNNEFLENILQKKIRKETKNKKYSYKDDMKSLNMGRQIKEFIWAKGMFEDYLNYIDSAIQSYYNSN